MDASDIPRTTETKKAECPTHGPFESRGLLLPFGKNPIWTRCPGCEAESRAEEEARRLAEEGRQRQARFDAELNRAGIPLRFRSRTLETFRASNDGQRHALQIAQKFAAEWDRHRTDGTTVVFSGAPGTGKSHLAIAVAQVLMTRTTVCYVSALDAIRSVRATWRRDSERSEDAVLRRFGEVGLLVLDEIGMQYGTEGEQVILFDIINRRYQDQMPTILLTNQGHKGLREYLGDRAFDRLREGGIWVAFDWASMRGENGKPE